MSVVLSLGTGDPPTEKVDSVDLRLPDSILGVVSAVSGASAMGRLLVDQAASATNRVVDRWEQNKLALSKAKGKLLSN